MNLFPLILVFLGVLLCLSMMVLAFAGPSGSKLAKARLQSVRERFSQSEAVRAQVQMRRILSQRDSALDSLVHSLLPNPAQLRKRLERTGKNWTLGGFSIACGAIFVVAFLFCTFEGMPLLLSIFVGLLLGLGIPHQVVNFFINRRVNRFTNIFPDAIDLLVRGLRSGLPISETMGVVAKEVPDPVGMEFRLVTDKIRIGRTMEQALQETADRIAIPEFQFFVITLSIQRETGGNLAETLSNLSDVLRKRAQMKLKIKAMSSESKASAYIVGALPFIVFGLVWMMNPSYMGGFFVDPRLMIAGIGGFIWMGIGAFVMAKMISFEI